MKYYTLDWCFGKMSEAELDIIHSEYISYIDTIFKELPFTIKTILRTISLHDGILNAISYNTQNHTLSLKGVFGDLNSGYFHLYLEYKNCQSNDMVKIKQTLSDQFLEVLSDEFELLESGKLKHSILFSNNSEVAFVFDDLKLNIENTSEKSYIKSACAITSH
jgi:hypothetical protein